MSAEAVLLDTNGLLGLTGLQAFRPAAIQSLSRAASQGSVLVSPISAWEIAQACKFRPTPELAPLQQDPLGWFQRRLAEPMYRLAPFTVEMAFNAYAMPDPFHRDPGDRLLVATARVLSVPIVTSDAKILAYAAAGHVAAIAC